MRKFQVQGTRYKVQTPGSFKLVPFNLYLRGFTLIEVLIAMTLLSIMVVLLFSSLRICADSWERGENKITAVNEVAVVYNFFQRHLAVALPLWNNFSAENQTFSFQGNAQSLQFVSAFPASAGRSGLQLFSIELQKEPDDQLINVTLTPFFPVAEGEEWHKEEVSLIKHVSNFSLAYFGSDDGVSEGIWQDEWLDKEVMPRLVKITIGLENEIYWPEMIIDLKITGAINNSDPEIVNINDPDNPGNSEITNTPEAIE